MYKHPADNHELQPEKRRRADVSSLGELPLSKTASKHGTSNTPTRTNSTVVAEPAKPPSSTSTNPSAFQAPKSTSTFGKNSTESSSKIQVDSNVEAEDLSSLKPPQASPIPLPTNAKSPPPSGGNNQAITNGLSSIHQIPIINDKQVMLPPERNERVSTEDTTGEHKTHLGDNLSTSVGVAEKVQKRKAREEEQPVKKSAKLTAVVSLVCGTSDEATKVLLTIAKKGLDTRFEVTQEGAESC